MGCGVLMGGGLATTVGGCVGCGWVVFFCGGGFGVLLCYFWCETVVGWDVGC